ncbi:MAG: hypothetical protein HKM95_15660 [Inquilinus sp.]|nr:hypothetical protein [Inquilinus sp.]
MFANILSDYLARRRQSVSEPAILSLKIDGKSFDTGDWSASGASLDGSGLALKAKEFVRGIVACDGVSGPFSGEVVAEGDKVGVRFREAPANVRMMMNMLRPTGA